MRAESGQALEQPRAVAAIDARREPRARRRAGLATAPVTSSAERRAQHERIAVRSAVAALEHRAQAAALCAASPPVEVAGGATRQAEVPCGSRTERSTRPGPHIEQLERPDRRGLVPARFAVHTNTRSIGMPDSVSAISRAASRLYAPIKPNGGSAGFVSGPSRLNTVRTPSARRTGATAFIAGW